jgi:hypothetical protein
MRAPKVPPATPSASAVRRPRHVVLAAAAAALLLGTGGASAQLPDGPVDWSVRRAVDLADLGLADGATIVGGGRRDLFFPVPRWAPVRDARLLVRFSHDAPEGSRSAVRFSVDDRPVRVLALPPGPSERVLELPWDGPLPGQSFVRLTVDYGTAATDDRCIDQRLPSGALRLDPAGTRVEHAADLAGLGTVRAAAEALPPDVRVTIPRRTPTPDEFLAAALAGAEMLRAGRAVAYARLPGEAGADPSRAGAAREVAARAGQSAADGVGPWLVAAHLDASAAGSPYRLGEIVVASSADLAGLRAAAARTMEALAARGDPLAADARSAALFRAPGGADAGAAGGALSVIEAGRQVSIALRPEAGPAAEALRLIRPSWRAVAGAPAADPRAVRDPGPRDDRLSFAALGLGDGLAESAGRAEWSVGLDATSIPPGRRAAALDLELSPGQAPAETAQLLYVSLGGTLLHAARIPPEGGPMRLTVPIPDGAAGRAGAVRVLLVRDPGGGDCVEAPASLPAQLHPTSAVVLGPAPERPRAFHELTVAFGAGVDLILPAGGLAEAERLLPLAARVLAGAVPPDAPVRLVVGARPDAPPESAEAARPFVALPGAPPPTGARLPVRLDAGAVRVEGRDGRVLLDVGGASSMLVAQLVRAGPADGLVLERLGAPPDLPGPLVLDRGTVAFLAADGPALAFDHLQETAVSLVQGDPFAWLRTLDRFRVAAVLGAWLLVTAGLVWGLSARARRRGGG